MFIFTQYQLSKIPSAERDQYKRKMRINQGIILVACMLVVFGLFRYSKMPSSAERELRNATANIVKSYVITNYDVITNEVLKNNDQLYYSTKCGWRNSIKKDKYVDDICTLPQNNNLQAIKFNDEKEYYVEITESTILRTDKNDKTKDFFVIIATFEESFISGREKLSTSFRTNGTSPEWNKKK
ncbi:hypothetical protein [Desulfovibrio desulfuricans]|uniref:hypothetical protein n=1 Tax=Desulfovibrio desulfuricans TaxID=876 RepID=UPI001AEA9140|nr:hypothetical protein [Desulfovibrio desulfuricans]QTO39701.1 hypothetical protein J8J02_11310 [Desulfovibrio desulfuricans]